MQWVTVDQIDYLIIAKTETIIKYFNESITTVSPRNCILFGGNRFDATHPRTPIYAKSIIIPYSVHKIVDPHHFTDILLKSLVFEFGSELLSLGSSTFRRSQLKSVFLPQSLSFIGQDPFSGCDSLSLIYFDCHSSLPLLHSSVFSSCKCLTAITIPASVRKIHSFAFGDCSRLSSVSFELPSKCCCFATSAFENCSLLKSVFLPPSVEVIDPSLWSDIAYIPHYSARDSSHFCVENDCLLGANGRQLIQYHDSSPTFCVGENIAFLSAGSFMLSKRLTTLVFDSQSRVQRLPAFCFLKSVRLCSVQVPKSVRVICEHCFEKCSELAKVAFESPPAIRTIESEAFCNCRRLASFTVPSSVSTLGDSVFSGCSGLLLVIFEPQSHLTEIPDQLFQGCHLLKTLQLPDSVIKIARSAFADSGVTSLTGADCMMHMSVLIRHGMTLHCFGSPSKVTIPSTVRKIADCQFTNTFSIVDLSFEEGLEHIGRKAFQGCHGLQTLTFPASLKIIGKSAFYCCESLFHIKFAPGSQLECIQMKAFANNDLEIVIVPSTVREIDPSAFDPDGWRFMRFDGPPPLLITRGFLCSADSRIVLRGFAERGPVVIPAGIAVIGPGAFIDVGLRPGISDCPWGISPETVIVPSSVETFGDRCFEGCTWMTTITFNDRSELKRIAERAFAKCGLTSITIPASTEEIDGSAFVGCPLIEIEVAPGYRSFLSQNIHDKREGLSQKLEK
jgi:hypothetical protein